MRSNTFNQTHIVLLGVLIFFLVINSVLLFTIPDTQSDSMPTANGELSAIIIEDSDCSQCVDAVQILEGFSVFGLEFDSVERMQRVDADKLIDKHKLDRFPAIIIEGESEMFSQFDVLEQSGDAYVWRDLGAPYVDADGELHGLVNVLAIDNRLCDKCADASTLVGQLESNGMVFDKQEIMDVADASNIIEQYSITSVPTIILSPQAADYSWLSSAWESIGTVESDGSFVLREVLPPYQTVGSDVVHGLVSATLLVDESCVDCVDPAQILQILQDNFGIIVDSQVKIDLASATGLVEKYDLADVPTVLLDAQALEYPAITAIWDQFGSIEDDNTLIVRSPELFGG